MLTELCASVASSCCKLAVGAWLQLVLLFLLPLGTCFLLLSKKVSSVDQTLKSMLYLASTILPRDERIISLSYAVSFVYIIKKIDVPKKLQLLLIKITYVFHSTV